MTLLQLQSQNDLSEVPLTSLFHSNGLCGEATRAWRLSGPRTGLLSTLFSNDQFGPSTIPMPFSCCYKEKELVEWTNEAKCQILDFCRQAEEEQPVTDPVFTTLFKKPNLVLSGMDSNHLEKLQEVLPKVNIIFYFRARDGNFYEWEQWARNRNVFLVLHDPERLVSELNSNNVDEEQDVKRRMFAAFLHRSHQHSEHVFEI